MLFITDLIEALKGCGAQLLTRNLAGRVHWVHILSRVSPDCAKLGWGGHTQHPPSTPGALKGPRKQSQGCLKHKNRDISSAE